jgi:non-canonical (house-cleaning) NTP pyrophosphatase
VCADCSEHTLVLPRLGIEPKRVCDGCYDRATNNPTLYFESENVEDGLKEKMQKETVRVAMLTTNSLEIQAVIQGISTALSGSPLGTQIDIESYDQPLAPISPRNSSSNNDQLDDSCLDYEESPEASTPIIAQTATHIKDSSKDESNQGVVEVMLNKHLFDEHEIHRRASLRAREARRKYRFEHNCEPDYSIGIEPGLVAMSGDGRFCDISEESQCLCYSWIVVIGMSPTHTHNNNQNQQSNESADVSEHSVVSIPDGAIHSSDDHLVISGCARTAAYALPPALVSRVLAGLTTLAEAQGGGSVDATDLYRLVNKNGGSEINYGKGGTVAYLTKGKITQALHLQSAIHLAFVPFLYPELFETTAV